MIKKSIGIFTLKAYKSHSLYSYCKQVLPYSYLNNILPVAKEQEEPWTKLQL